MPPPPPTLFQLCVPGYSKDNGKCSKCLTSSYGRLTHFGIFVVSLVASAVAMVVPLFGLRVGKRPFTGPGTVGQRCCLVGDRLTVQDAVKLLMIVVSHMDLEL